MGDGKDDFGPCASIHQVLGLRKHAPTGDDIIEDDGRFSFDIAYDGRGFGG